MGTSEVLSDHSLVRADRQRQRGGGVFGGSRKRSKGTSTYRELTEHGPVESTSGPSSTHVLPRPRSCGTHTRTAPRHCPPRPSSATNRTSYTRPSPAPLRSARTAAVGVPTPTPSGQLLASSPCSGAPTTGSSWLMPVMRSDTASPSGSTTPPMAMGTGRWSGGHSVTGSAATWEQSGARLPPMTVVVVVVLVVVDVTSALRSQD